MNDEEVEAFLEHHGIKGMHWGIRNKNPHLDRVSRVARGTETRRVNQKKVLTKKELAKRRQRRSNLISLSALGLYLGAQFIAYALVKHNPSMGDIPYDRPSAKNASHTVEDIINATRNEKVSAIIRTQKEGHIDAEQAAKFISAINKKYARKVADAAAGL